MRPRATIFCILAIPVLLLFPSEAGAQRCISILPDTTVAAIDMQLTLDVAVNDLVDSLMGFDVVVGFDRSYLDVVRVEKGSLLSTSGHPTFFGWLNEGCACDSIVVNGSILGATIDGPGTLFTITFKALRPGRIAVPFMRTDLRNGANEKLTHAVEEGFVIIEPPIGAEPSSWSSVKSLYK
jgi:hypothetical protein